MDERTALKDPAGRGDCAGAILVRGDRLLLGRRSPDAPRFPDRWDVLGGHVEPGESFADALRREVEEEAGVTPTAYRELSRHPIAGGELRLYVVIGWTGGGPCLRGPEHAELRWFSRAEACALPGLAAPELADVFRGLAIETW